MKKLTWKNCCESQIENLFMVCMGEYDCPTSTMDQWGTVLLETEDGIFDTFTGEIVDFDHYYIENIEKFVHYYNSNEYYFESIPKLGILGTETPEIRIILKTYIPTQAYCEKWFTGIKKTDKSILHFGHRDIETTEKLKLYIMRTHKDTHKKEYIS